MKHLINRELKQSALAISLLFLSFFTLAQSNALDNRYEEGVAALKNLDRLQAEKIFRSILEDDPKHAPSLFQMGVIELHFEHTDIATDYFQQVVAINQEFIPDANFEMSKLKMKAGEDLEAFDLLNQVIDSDPENDEALFNRGILFLVKKEFENAKNDFNRAILTNSNEYKYFYHRGLSEIELEDYPSAIEDLTRVIQQAPKYENAYFYRGYAYYQEGLDPSFKHHKALFQKSLDDYNQCIKLNQRDDVAYFNRGEAHMRLHNYVEAIADFKKALKLNPSDLEAHYNKAMCNYLFGYEDLALTEFKQVLEMDSTYADALFQVALINYEFQNFNAALNNFNSLIQVEEAHADAYTYRGYTHLEMGNNKLACADWTIADELGDREAHLDRIKYCGINNEKLGQKKTSKKRKKKKR